MVAGVEFVQKLEFCTQIDSGKTGPIGPVSSAVFPANEGQIRPLLTGLNHDGERIKVWADVVQDGEKITHCIENDSGKTEPIGSVSAPVLPTNEGQIRPSARKP